MPDAFAEMDSMYRYQRYFYDATRKFYLLGRDRLIERMELSGGDRVLEVGCGTGRNLIILAKQYPGVRFFGLDASSAMLETARTNIAAKGLRNIALATALADEFDFRETFGLERPFDVIFFSYSISMISSWKESLLQALTNLAPGGILYLVDFYDQTDLPAWFRKLLKNWLGRFHVQYWTDLHPYLEEMAIKHTGKLEISSIGRRYAFIAKLSRAP